MSQAQLERAVCRATGESRDVVRRHGFQLIVAVAPDFHRPPLSSASHHRATGIRKRPELVTDDRRSA
jgi:hypothetical protein